jgi:uncharacterized membrane protein
VATLLTAATAAAAPTTMGGQAAGPTRPDTSRQVPPTADPNGAFLFRKGRFTPLGGIPGVTVSAHINLNNRGQVVGTWDDRPEDPPVIDPNTRHGFLWDNGRLTRFDVPRSLATGALGINNAGQITGAYDDAAGRHHGFVLWRGRYTTIDAPGRMVTDAWASTTAARSSSPIWAPASRPSLG